jgi:acetolactate decarboxylase
MRRILSVFLILSIVFAAFGLLHAQSADHSIFQVSTFHALKQGKYDGETTFEELKKHGDFGIGTLNGLYGEMLALDGEFFQIKADGKVYTIPDEAKTPFAVVTFFKRDYAVAFAQAGDMKDLQKALDTILPLTDEPCAIRVDGDFKYIKVRSVPRQEKPYPGLEEALKHQTEFELKNVRGTMVGFRFPAYMDGLNIPGYHFHFITADKKAGGHVLNCSFEEDAEAYASLIPNLSVRLLKNSNPAPPSQ